MRDSKKAFTLVEVMFVTLIIGLLLSMGMVAAAQCRKNAQESYCVANLKAVAAGFEIYAASHGRYAPGEVSDLQFLLDAGCLHKDFTTMRQLGNFRYLVADAGLGGYDIRAMAVNTALSNHNYQITTGGQLKRSKTADPGDTDFEPL